MKDQLQQHQIQLNEGEKLRRLKEKAQAQEAKLAKIRMMCGQVESNRYFAVHMLLKLLCAIEVQ